jgi:two-component system KDP operon response regulator KdpE
MTSQQLPRSVPRDAKRILVVDDEPRMIGFIRMNLELENFQVVEAHNGSEALEMIRTQLPDLVLLDVMMPKLDGYETLRTLREFSSIPVIMLTAKGEEEDIVYGLELGADDYIPKPFSPKVLSSRVRAVLRRSEMPSASEKAVLEVDERLSVDFNRREVIVNGEHVKLRPTEYRLLYHLIQNAGWVMPHETLLTKVWGHEYINDNHLLRLYINYLRKKIEKDPADPQYIFTERGLGYRFVDFKKESENA